MATFEVILNDLFFALVGFACGIVLSDYLQSKSFTLKIRRRK